MVHAVYLFEGVLADLLLNHVQNDGSFSHGSFAPKFCRMRVGSAMQWQLARVENVF